MNPAPNVPESIAFGRFRIFPHRRKLFAGDQPIKLGGRAFDLLLALIETPGAVVGKDALTSRVWPGRAIGENNLQTQISALRNALGAERDLIRNVAGRGYQFTGEIPNVSRSPDKPVAARPLMASGHASEAPEYQLRAPQGLWFANAASGRHRAALTVAQKSRVLTATRSDPNDRLVGEPLVALSQHLLGDQPSARHHLEHVLAPRPARCR
jgi:DNA-binding winged helix-turn-helix (wHTH) protein